MTRLFIILIIVLGSYSVSIGCCAERDYRLFPIGELDNAVVFIEFDLFRNCESGTGGEENNEFWTRGTVQLVHHQEDSLVVIATIDTVNFKECVCTYEDYYSKTEYESLLAPSYRKALGFAKKENGFLPGRPMEIVFNDTSHTTVIEKSTDSTYAQIVSYSDLITIDLGEEEIISCYPSVVSEVRTYETKSFQIMILRLRCRLIDEQAMAHNLERFKKTETAFWKEQAQWHGIAKDYWIVRENDN